MHCETCHGAGWVPAAPGEPAVTGTPAGDCDGRWKPCPECGGHAFQHCCDGLQAQPEPPCLVPDDAPRRVPMVQWT